MYILEVIILCITLSIDSFLTCFTYSASNIKVPRRAVITIALTCTFFLVLSILAGSSVMTIIDPFAANVISFGLLFCIGLSRIFDTQIKWLISKMHSKNILGIYADPYIVDSDKSNCISVIEAIVLSAALSLDGISVGFALGLKCFNIWLIGGCSIIVQVASVIGGVNLGGKLYRVIGNAPSKTMKYLDVNITAISGLVLILIGLFRFCM